MTPPQTVEEALDEIRQMEKELAHAAHRRNRAIHSARKGGATLRQIAEVCGCSKDTVRKILRQRP